MTENKNELDFSKETDTTEQIIADEEAVDATEMFYDNDQPELPGQQSIFESDAVSQENDNQTEILGFMDTKESEEHTKQFYNETIMKQKKQKVWFAGFTGAIIGALLFSLLSPFISTLITNTFHSKFAFSVPEHKNDTESINTLINDKDDNIPLSASEIGQTMGPSVVGIISNVESSGFFSQGKQNGSGSGIIMSKAGHIITNYHVIQNASSVKVVLNTGKEYDATLIGGDDKSDLAVIKIDAPDLSPAVFGDSDGLAAGDMVVAIGNPLGVELAGSLTQGIVSAVNRTIFVGDRNYKMIQTDAAINPGNSGGLVNDHGEVIGINSVKVSIAGVEGLGFAIPISDAMPIIEDLMNFGFVKGRPLIGLSLRFVTQSEAYYYGLSSEGLYVVDVAPGTGAEKAGILKGDIVVSCEGKDIASVVDLNEIRDEHKAGDTITLKINRNNEVLEVKVILGEDTSAQKMPKQ